MFNFLIQTCMILMINTGEENIINEQTSCNYCENCVYFNPYYNFNNISTGDDNAWDTLIFHSFATPQEQKYKILPIEINEIRKDLTSHRTDSSTKMYDDSYFFNEQKNINLNNSQVKKKIEEVFTKCNASKLRVKDQNDIDEILTNVESTKSIFSNNHSFEKKNFNADYKLKKDLRKRRDIILENSLVKTKLKIKECIMRNMPKGYIRFYEKRLEIINRSFDHFDQNFLDLKEEPLLLSSREHKILASLNQLYLNSKKFEVFDQKSCNLFSIEFDFHFSNQMRLLPFDKTLNPLSDYVQYHFYFEIMKLYKHIHEIPELLTLTGLFSDRPYCYVPFVLHVINMFFDYIENPKNNRIFILCLISKAFLSSSRKFLDFFTFLEYNPLCKKEHLHMYVFLWSIDPAKRKDMKKRLEQDKSFKCKLGDEDHSKLTLAIYLYQYIEFLIFYGYDEEIINNFCKYVTDSLYSEDCFACCFEVFLEIAKKHSEAIK